MIRRTTSYDGAGHQRAMATSHTARCTSATRGGGCFASDFVSKTRRGNTQPARSMPARSSIEEVGQHGSGSKWFGATPAAVGAEREVRAVPAGVDRAGDAAGGGRAVH